MTKCKECGKRIESSIVAWSDKCAACLDRMAPLQDD